MEEILFDDLLEKIPNKYLLTLVAGKRARDIIEQRRKLGNDDIQDKETVTREVLQEIIAGTVGVNENG